MWNPDEQADGNSQDPNSQRFQQQREQEDLDTGLYYVLLPDGRLQRVAYSGSRLAAQPQQQQRQQQQLFSEQPHQLTNGYYAQIQYHDVEPIKAPIYTYSAPLIRLYK
uniref:(California timema) hypothetical protein n=1 Tax=Timema californicum TaxID=61474 RepID=A0A7R9JH57_TIMCA|nr:unnamed protein product [Timema californicum]